MIADLRTYDANRRPPGMGNWYCPRCSCRKGGWADEPNARDEGCSDDDCLCHRDARCSCCDGPDGLGFYHFANASELRRFLDTPGHETHVDIDVTDIPGEPYALTFVTAGEAEAWLEEYDERVREELSIERVLGPRARPPYRSPRKENAK